MNNKLALVKRWLKILVGKSTLAVKQGPGKIYSIAEIEGYYNDMTEKLKGVYRTDKQGIMMNRTASGQYVYFPINIFQNALAVWDMYIMTNLESYKTVFLNSAKWALDNQRNDGAWDSFSSIGHTKYTVSSMGQGQGISVLLRAYKLTKNEVYKNAAYEAAQFMIKPIEDGGTLHIDGECYVFEEYPNKYEKPVSVLNGWIFSLFGLIDYLKIFNDNKVSYIYEKSLNTLKVELKNYDSGYWSFYDKCGRMASPAYHSLHIALLDVMYDLTGNIEFKNYATLFSSYSNSGVKRFRAIVKKLFQKLHESSEGILIE